MQLRSAGTGAPRVLWWAVALLGLSTLVFTMAAPHGGLGSSLLWLAPGAVVWFLLVRRRAPRNLWAFLWLVFWCLPTGHMALLVVAMGGAAAAGLGLYAVLFLSQLWVVLDVAEFPSSAYLDDDETASASED